MSQSDRQSRRYDHVVIGKLEVEQSNDHVRHARMNVSSDTNIQEYQSGVIFNVQRNGVRLVLPTRPRAGTTIIVRNMLTDGTFIIVFSQEDSFFGGNIPETKEGTSLRCLGGVIGDEVTLVADGIDGYVISSLIGSKWSTITI